VATCFRSCRHGPPEPDLAAGIRRVKNAKRSPFSVISLQHRDREIARISCETAISRRESTPKVLPGSTSCYFGRSEGRLKVIAEYGH
jgi:hypothetical protein